MKPFLSWKWNILWSEAAGSGNASEQRVPDNQRSTEEVQAVWEREEGDGRCDRAGNIENNSD